MTELIRSMLLSRPSQSRLGGEELSSAWSCCEGHLVQIHLVPDRKRKRFLGRPTVVSRPARKQWMDPHQGHVRTMRLGCCKNRHSRDFWAQNSGEPWPCHNRENRQYRGICPIYLSDYGIHLTPAPMRSSDIRGKRPLGPAFAQQSESSNLGTKLFVPPNSTLTRNFVCKKESRKGSLCDATSRLLRHAQHSSSVCPGLGDLKQGLSVSESRVARRSSGARQVGGSAAQQTTASWVLNLGID